MTSIKRNMKGTPTKEELQKIAQEAFEQRLNANCSADVKGGRTGPGSCDGPVAEKKDDYASKVDKGLSQVKPEKSLNDKALEHGKGILNELGSKYAAADKAIKEFSKSKANLDAPRNKAKLKELTKQRDKIGATMDRIQKSVDKFSEVSKAEKKGVGNAPKSVEKVQEPTSKFGGKDYDLNTLNVKKIEKDVSDIIALERVPDKIFEDKLKNIPNGSIDPLIERILEDANYHQLNKALSVAGKFAKGAYYHGDFEDKQARDKFHAENREALNTTEKKFAKYQKMGGKTWEL
jgi:hypothetical protein